MNVALGGFQNMPSMIAGACASSASILQVQHVALDIRENIISELRRQFPG